MHVQTVLRVFHHRQMRKQGKALEDHGGLLTAKLQQLARAHGDHVLLKPIDRNQNLPSARVDEPVDVPNQGAFPRTRQTHHHLNASCGHVDFDVAQTQNVAVHIAQFLLAHAVLHRGQKRLGVGPKILYRCRIEMPTA